MHRWLGLAAALACAGCAAKTRDASPVPVPTTAAPPVVSAAPAPRPPPALPSLDELASRQVRLAPGMRELARGETATTAPLPAAEKDTCVRVVFVAGTPVKVTLVAKNGSRLAVANGASEGVLDRDGPVCFRRDAEPRLVVEGDAGAARFVVWGAP